MPIAVGHDDSRVDTDVLIVGAGLGAAAAARGLLKAGFRVALVPGVGCSRSPHVDGGLVDAELVASVFGAGAPLGEPVDRQVAIRALSPGQVERGATVMVEPRNSYRRQQLERWALRGVVEGGGIFLEGFVEGKVFPGRDDSVVLTSERGDREIHANVIALCEGADPRIGMRLHLRPDYGPEDQVHFARTVFHGEPPDLLRRGLWRTSWGMPVEVSLNPQSDGTLVSVVTRIENVMRSGRSSKDALEDMLASAAFRFLDVTGERGDTGMELVPLRPHHRGMKFVHDRLLMGLDSSGVIDPRRPDRADLTIRAGQRLAACLVEGTLALDEWQESASGFVHDVLAPPSAYHDDKETGFLEEGPARMADRLAGRITTFLRRGQRTSTSTG